MNIQRMADRSKSTVNRLLDSGNRGETASLPASAWTVDTVQGPNITDKETILSFARMAANAYVTEPYTGEWEDVRAPLYASRNPTDKGLGWRRIQLYRRLWLGA